MKSKRRRFEVMLPRKFNDGTTIPPELLADAVFEVVAEFGGATYYPGPVEGYWVHEGVRYYDTHAKLQVDVPDSPKSRGWMRDFKARWKERLRQIELWMVSYRIEIE